MAKAQSNINDFANRFESPVVGIRINPKTGKPIKKTTGSNKTQKNIKAGKKSR